MLALDPKPYWHDQQWAAKALAARGDVDGAVNLMEGLRSRHAPDMALSAIAEQLLLDAGRVDEAYARYAIQATSANTNIATYRAIAKRYPSIEPSRILSDLIASTPGEEGKWFATAKTLKQYDLAIALARRSCSYAANSFGLPTTVTPAPGRTPVMPVHRCGVILHPTVLDSSFRRSLDHRLGPINWSAAA